MIEVHYNIYLRKYVSFITKWKNNIYNQHKVNKQIPVKYLTNV